MLNICRWIAFGWLVLCVASDVLAAYKSAKEGDKIKFVVMLVSIPNICFAAWYIAVKG